MSKKVIPASVAVTPRILAGGEAEEHALNELIGELSVRSPEFRRLWARHDTRRTTGGAKRFVHPVAGVVDLRREALTITGTDQTLIAYHAEPDSPSHQALAVLAALTPAGAASASPDRGDRAKA